MGGGGRDRKTHPYEVEAAITFLDAASDRPRAEAAAERLGRLVREQGLVGTQPEGYSAGEIHHPHDFAKRADSLARRWFSDAEIDASLDQLESRAGEHGGWDITWAVWTPAIEIEWSGLVTIAALKTLRSYGACLARDLSRTSAGTSKFAWISSVSSRSSRVSISLISLVAPSSSSGTSVFGRYMTENSVISIPASVSEARTAVRSDGSDSTSKTSSSITMSSAPASTAGIRSSSE